MSDTPETDKIAKSLLYENADKRDYKLRQHARRLERDRNAALIGYNECRATIEDARVALNAHEYEGLLLASLRIQDQLAAERALADRLAALLQRNRDLYGGQQVDPQCGCWDCEYLRPIDDALTAWKEARGE